MDWKKIALMAASGCAAVAIFAAWLWQPERQVRLHQKHFLQSVERRNWRALGNFLADDYADRWGHDKAFVLAATREVFGQFLFLTLEQRTEECFVEGTTGTARTTVRLAGSGGPAAGYAMSAVNGLRAPFVFTWERRGRPWDWQLTRVEHRELDLDHVPSL